MADFVGCFAKSGLMLWSRTLMAISSPVFEFLINHFIQGHGNDRQTVFENYALKWCFSNEFDIIFVAIYQKMFSLFYVDQMLEETRDQFVKNYRSRIIGTTGRIKGNISFDSVYDGILETHMNRSAKESVKMTDTHQSNVEKSTYSKQENSTNFKKVQVSDDNDSDDATSELRLSQSKANQDQFKIAEPKSKAQNKAASKKSSKKSSTIPAVEKRVWRFGNEKVSSSDAKSLDYSLRAEKSQLTATNTDTTKNLIEIPIEEEAEDIEPESNFSTISSWFSTLTKKTLSEADLAPILTKFSNKLIAKNVSYEISVSICEGIKAGLVGRVISSFESISSIIATCTSNALSSILSNSSSSLLTQISTFQSTPFVITIIGVNGVGKSTSLAKIAYYLKQHNKTVLIAACDTFRSGAIEQLRVHATRLNVVLIQGNYGQDANQIATNAIDYAKLHHIDVVLVDTAGRMQNNDPLLKSLNDLVSHIKPQLNLFVSEALVGNDGTNQLTLFNQALQGRINGLVLTKMDAVGNKVGSALSLSFSSNIPILFVGNGQKYTHLKEFNEKMIVKALFNDDE